MSAAAKTSAKAGTKAKKASALVQRSGSTGSLAGTVKLPYRPTSFKMKDLRKAVADVKRAQG